jgi:hypothetical protein
MAPFPSRSEARRRHRFGAVLRGTTSFPTRSEGHRCISGPFWGTPHHFGAVLRETASFPSRSEGRRPHHFGAVLRGTTSFPSRSGGTASFPRALRGTPCHFRAVMRETASFPNRSQGDSIISEPFWGRGIVSEPFWGRLHRFRAVPRGGDAWFLSCSEGDGIISAPFRSEETASFPGGSEGTASFQWFCGEETASFRSRSEGRQRLHFGAVLGETAETASFRSRSERRRQHRSGTARMSTPSFPDPSETFAGPGCDIAFGRGRRPSPRVPMGLSAEISQSRLSGEAVGKGCLQRL